jgi:hypothetical protein
MQLEDKTMAMNVGKTVFILLAVMVALIFLANLIV